MGIGCGHLIQAFGISMGSSARRALDKRGEIGRIHSVFQNALHILTKDRRLIGIVGQRSYSMPINLKVWIPNGLTIGDLGLKSGASVRRSGDLIILDGDFSIDLRGVRIWKPIRRPLGAFDAARLSRSIEIIEDMASRRASSEGLGLLIPHRRELIANEFGAIPSNDPMISRAARSIANLFKAVKEGDRIGIDRSAMGLIGLGPGLTPSGDDFLIGFLASSIFGATGDPHRFRFQVGSLRKSVLRARASTTLLSQEFFLHAVEGDVAEPINDLIVALFDGSSQLGSLANRVIEMGETSGMDTLLGIIMGTSLFI
ncbi:MAG: DUF2877 domain-containing protein [Candidatus Bathyarchaeia archaeon]